jgi:ribosomal protein S18 acetylase RimI-like enzyme
LLGKPSFWLSENPEGDKNFFAHKDNCFVQTKVPTEQVEKIRRLESLKFNLIDTNLTFEACIHQFNKISKTPDSFSIRFARAKDRKEISEIAQTSFSFSRFHLDPSVPNKTANQIKREWAENYFNGQRGEFMVVAVADDHLAGFCQILHRGDILIIDLIAVQPSHRQKGLAEAMISFLGYQIQEKLKKLKAIRVGTQISNLPSIALYEKIGFRILSSEYVFHYHGKPDTEL